MFVAIPDEEREGYLLLEEIDEPESVYVGKHFAYTVAKRADDDEASGGGSKRHADSVNVVMGAIDSLLNGESERQRVGANVGARIDDMVPLVIKDKDAVDSAGADDDGNIADDMPPEEIILALGEAAAPEYRMSVYERMSPFYGGGIMEEKAMHETFAAASLDRDAILGTFDDDDERRDAAFVYDALYGTEATSSARASSGAVYGGAAAAVLSFDQDKLNDIRQRIISSASELMTKRSTLDYDV